MQTTEQILFALTIYLVILFPVYHNWNFSSILTDCYCNLYTVLYYSLQLECVTWEKVLGFKLFERWDSWFLFFHKADGIFIFVACACESWIFISRWPMSCSLLLMILHYGKSVGIMPFKYCIQFHYVLWSLTVLEALIKKMAHMLFCVLGIFNIKFENNLYQILGISRRNEMTYCISMIIQKFYMNHCSFVLCKRL